MGGPRAWTKSIDDLGLIENPRQAPFAFIGQSEIMDALGPSPRSRLADRKQINIRPLNRFPGTWVDNSNKWAGGGYLSNTQDLALFGDAMITGKVVKPATLDLLWTSQRTTDGKPTGYGIGWVVATDSAGRKSVRHSGGSDGGTALLVLYPQQRIVFAFLFNSDGPQPPLQRVIDLFVGR